MRHPAALIALATAWAAAQTGNQDPKSVILKPYEMAWRADSGVLADLSFLLDKPAGGKGFVSVRDGHLADGAGRRLRIFGVNFSFTASTPAREVARDVAAHLARFGVNCVRIHHLDWRAPRGVIDAKFPDSRHLDPAALDRLDNFVAELKKAGVYVNLNLNVARSFQPADGVKDAAQLGFAKAVTYFDPRIVELEKEYARTLLTHRNPYTGAEYRNEPAVAMVEIVNENSLIESWKAGRLRGLGPDPKQEDRTWSDIPASYAADLTRLYNAYLEKRLDAASLRAIRAEAGVTAGAPVPRLEPAAFSAASALRFSTEASFYMDLENSFLGGMYAFLKQELGVRVPVVGTSIHNGGLTPYPLLASTSKLDMVDSHTYWQHPRFLSDASGRRIGFEIGNTPAVNEPERSPLLALARVAVAGKPFMVSEVNHPYPNEYGAEGVPLLAAYAAFQDWDAIFWYSFSHSPAETWDKPALPGHFDMRQDPVKMTQWAASALLFHTAAVAPARTVVERSYDHASVVESVRTSAAHGPFFTSWFPGTVALRHGVRVKSLEAPRPTAPVAAPAPPYLSDTGQLRWLLSPSRKGLVVVDADRWQALIGYPKSQSAAPSNLGADVANEFCSIAVGSMDGKPVRTSARLLLAAGARASNVGMQWNEKRTGNTDLGQPGTTIEPVTGVVKLRLDGARSVEATPLDGAGRAGGAPVQASRSGAEWVLRIGETPTPWYLVTVRR